MMQRNKPWESYRKVATQTATKGQLVLMLYDGALGFLEKALVGFDYKDPATFNQTINNNLLRAQAIIMQMNASLNMQDGGDVAENFRRLYNYFFRRLREANRYKKREPIEETIQRLRVLRNSWAEMLRRGESTPENAMEAAAA
jgi:flagellar protein FliS